MAVNVRRSTSDSLLTESEAADILGVKPRWLQLDRFGAKRVPFVRVSPRRIRYQRSDLDDYIAANREGGPSVG